MRRVLMIACVLALAGCGAENDRESTLRPPVPINVTAAIDAERVRVSPQSFGAGPVVFIISNSSDARQEVTFETDELGGDRGGIRRSAGPIAPRSTGTLTVDARQGTYTLSASSAGVREARVRVSEPRPSSQNQLLLP